VFANDTEIEPPYRRDMEARTTEEGTEMKRRKRFTIRLVALGFAVAALSAPAAQAKLDEGLGYHWAGAEQQGMISPDDRSDRVMPGQTQQSVAGVKSSQQVLSADDLSGRVTPAPSRLTVVASDDGFEWGKMGISGIALLLGAAGAYLILNESQKGRLAST
jgi:hypothetical protein